MMVYPSFYEGFGLPPLEAMACGTAVIAAKTSSLPEILGDAALWCDPFDAADMAEQIRRLYLSPTLRERLTKKGKEKAAACTWQKAAAETAAAETAAVVAPAAIPAATAATPVATPAETAAVHRQDLNLPTIPTSR